MPTRTCAPDLPTRSNSQPPAEDPAGAPHHSWPRAPPKGYFQEALREYEKAIEGGKQTQKLLQAMLELYLLQREPWRSDCQPLIDSRANSRPREAWNGRGVALQLEGRHAEAEDSYNARWGRLPATRSRRPISASFCGTRATRRARSTRPARSAGGSTRRSRRDSTSRWALQEKHTELCARAKIPSGTERLTRASRRVECVGLILVSSTSTPMRETRLPRRSRPTRFRRSAST